MPEFHDNLQRRWAVNMTEQTRHRIQLATGAELGPHGIAELAALASRPDLVAEALWQACWVDAAERKITRGDFLAAIDDGATRRGWISLVEAFAGEYFPEKAKPVVTLAFDTASRIARILNAPAPVDESVNAWEAA